MTTFETVIVPLDGSQLAETAIPYAASLARITGASLVLLRVLEEMRPLYDSRRREVIWIDPENPRKDLMTPEILQPEVERLAQQGLKANPVIRLGDPRHEILAEAEQHPAPLIVLASQGRSGLGRVLLGSVASRILQLATCPVLVVRSRELAEQPQTITFKRLVVPLDGSLMAQQALPLAVNLAKQAGASLEVVRVAETFRQELPPEGEALIHTASLETLLENFDRLEAEARDYIAAVTALLEEEGVPVTGTVLSGDPFQELVNYAELERPDLMIMTTHGRGGLARWFYGSVADKLLTTSVVPLLLIRAQEEEAEG